MATPDIFLKKRTRKQVRINSGPSLFAGLEAEPLPPPPQPDAKSVPDALPVTTPADTQGVATPAVEPEARPDPAHVFTVGELVADVRARVEGRYRRVTVEGEISNWRPAGSGHCYFTLKDRSAQLSAVMFRREAALLRFRPKDGDSVRLRGQLSIYEARGQMQVIASSMELAGIGAQLAAVQELKQRLRAEGLFDRKRPLPEFPRCIGVVTSLQGAALRDIIKVCRRRHAAVNLLVYPAAVQGPNCAREVAAGVRWFSEHKDRADVVLVARGGGSWEDLHGFDDEGIARAIAACSIPVITGIGHATDSVIADAAADVCAPTPSAAAELLTAAQHRVEERVSRLRERVLRAGGYELLRARQRLLACSTEAVLGRATAALRRRGQHVDELEGRVRTAAARRLQMANARLQATDARLQRQHVALRLAEDGRRLQNLQARLRNSAEGNLQQRRALVERLGARVDTLSPLRVLERGYALVYGPEGKLLRSAAEVEAGAAVRARLAQGSVLARVESTEP